MLELLRSHPRRTGPEPPVNGLQLIGNLEQGYSANSVSIQSICERSSRPTTST